MSNLKSDIILEAGSIPYRIIEGKIEVLLITSLKKKKWIFPKGIIEPGVNCYQTAINETYEEAGIKGIIEESEFASYDVNKWGSSCQVVLFPLKITEIFNKWPEKKIRDRKWFTAEKLNQVQSNKIKEILFNFFIRSKNAI